MARLNLKAIEERVAPLGGRDSYDREFIFELLLAYGKPQGNVTRLRNGSLSVAVDPATEVAQKNVVYFKETTDDPLAASPHQIRRPHWDVVVLGDFTESDRLVLDLTPPASTPRDVTCHHGPCEPPRNPGRFSAGVVTTTPGQDSAPATCQKRRYTFDVNSNRSRTTSSDCATGSAAATTWAYNAGDASTTGGNGQGAYSYGAFGRQTTIPKADTPTGDGDLTIGYYHDDAPRLVAQGGVVTTFTRDAAGRRLGQSTTGWAQTPQDASAVGELVRHYGDDSDNPTWVTFEGGTERYLPGLGGDLGLQMNTRGQTAETELTVTNPHGDIVTTIPLGDGNTATGISAWSDYTEYGTPRTPATTGLVHGVTGYGWLGGKERATPTGTFGLTLMGARLYNPVTGRFTTTDPVYGGNANTYTYPADPINMTDLNGLWSWGKRKWRQAKNAWSRQSRAVTGNSRAARWYRGGCSWAPGIAGSACSAHISASYWQADRRESARWGATALASSFGGNYASKAWQSKHLFGKLPRMSFRRGWKKRGYWRSRFSGRRSAIYWSSHIHGMAAGGFVDGFGRRFKWWGRK